MDFRDRNTTIALRAHGCATQQNLSSPFLDGLKQQYLTLMNSTWRQRVWIFQETVLSGQFIFVDDNAFIEMQDLGYLCAVLDFRDSSYDDELHVSRFWHNNERYLKQYSCGNQHLAATVLLATDHVRTTVPPDVYFGLCGVLKIDIGYALNRPVSEVRIEFFRALIKKGDYSWI